MLLTMSLAPMGLGSFIGSACPVAAHKLSGTEHARRRASIVEKADMAARKLYNAMGANPPVRRLMGMATFLIQKKA